MNTAQALDRIAEIAQENGEGILETLQYMNDNLDELNDNFDRFSVKDRQAFRIAMAGFQKLFAPAE